MKKIIVAILLLVGIAEYSQAQEFRMGFHIDPGIGYMRPDVKYMDGGSRGSFGYGALMDYYFHDRYAISLGVNHLFNGGKLTLADSLAQNEFSIQYIELPLAIKLRTNQMGSQGLSFYGQMGLTPAINIKTKVNGNKAKDTAKPLNLGFSIGAGVQYPIDDPTALFLGIYFTNGFTNVVKNLPKESKVTLSNIGFKVGVIF
ncbi:MAG: porin family protein [Chitinophagales bacterium]|nr:PorT family protein [Bacteroidota bacterium]MCB9042310.1 PorT family protein [Chitinophagales bacterium]